MNQHRQPPVPPSNPFEHDLLERQPTVERYTALLEQAGSPCVFALNGGWGAGKTTFIGFWAKHLRSREFNPVIFNIWRSNLTPQTLAGEIDQISHHTEGRPLVVFIDELDRHPPSFIIECLRHIEPWFHAENLVFVFGINIREIEKSLRAVYGEEFDAAGYLRRFFSHELDLPQEESVRKQFVLELCGRLGVPAARDRVSRGEEDYVRRMLADFLGASDLEIRDILQILSRLRAIFRLAPAGPLDYALFTTSGCRTWAVLGDALQNHCGNPQ